MPAGEILFYSELNLNQYSVGSPCRTICTICGSPPCPGLNLIHYKMVGYDQFFEFIREYPNQIIVYILCAKLEARDVFQEYRRVINKFFSVDFIKA